MPRGEKNFPASYEGEDEQPYAEDQKAKHRTHAEADDPGRKGMDVLQPDVGDQIQPHGDRSDEKYRKDDEADEYAFFRFRHVL